MRLCFWSLASASSIPVFGLQRVCPQEGLFLALASSLVSSTPPLPARSGSHKPSMLQTKKNEADKKIPLYYVPRCWSPGYRGQIAGMCSQGRHVRPCLTCRIVQMITKINYMMKIKCFQANQNIYQKLY